MIMRPEPRHPGRLVGSKWSRCDDDRAYTHYLAVEISDDDVILEPVLRPAATLRIAWRALRDRTRWLPGWT